MTTERGEPRRKQSLNPQQVSEGVWYYEKGRKLGFVVSTGSGHIQFSVPMAMLERSIARSPKKRKTRRSGR